MHPYQTYRCVCVCVCARARACVRDTAMTMMTMMTTTMKMTMTMTQLGQLAARQEALLVREASYSQPHTHSGSEMGVPGDQGLGRVFRYTGND